jgi:Na+/H+-translocating membrane pyrophosphatase
MLLYFFPAMTLKGVENTALKLIKAARRQFNNTPGFMEGTTKPNYVACVMFPTKASIMEMNPSGALVILTLLVAGSFMGGVQTVICVSNIGSAWDNAKKYNKAGASEHVLFLWKDLSPSNTSWEFLDEFSLRFPHFFLEDNEALMEGELLQVE